MNWRSFELQRLSPCTQRSALEASSYALKLAGRDSREDGKFSAKAGLGQNLISATSGGDFIAFDLAPLFFGLFGAERTLCNIVKSA